MVSLFPFKKSFPFKKNLIHNLFSNADLFLITSKMLGSQGHFSVLKNIAIINGAKKPDVSCLATTFIYLFIFLDGGLVVCQLKKLKQ